MICAIWSACLPKLLAETTENNNLFQIENIKSHLGTKLTNIANVHSLCTQKCTYSKYYEFS
jgi:hypothetical protein